jgi:hypothetical protein
MDNNLESALETRENHAWFVIDWRSIASLRGPTPRKKEASAHLKMDVLVRRGPGREGAMLNDSTYTVSRLKYAGLICNESFRNQEAQKFDWNADFLSEPFLKGRWWARDHGGICVM